jgi:tetrahydromethanopterin S-methyltransferase subunit G
MSLTLENMSLTLENIKKLIHEKFEKIDARFEKIDARLDNIEKKVDDIDKIKVNLSDLNDKVNKNTKYIEELVGYRKNEDIGIEQEISKIIKEHYRDNYRKDATFIKFPLKKIYDYTGNPITDYDYSIIAKYKVNDIDIYDLIIIEAKHHITLIKVLKKLEQIFKIKKIITDFKDKDFIYNPEIYHSYFNNDIETLKNNNIYLKNCNNIYFYVGGPTWDNSAEDFINKIIETTTLKDINNISFKTQGYKPKISFEDKNEILNYIKDKIGIIIPSGNRYILKDLSTIIKTGGNTNKKNKTYKLNIFC